MPIDEISTYVVDIGPRTERRQFSGAVYAVGWWIVKVFGRVVNNGRRSRQSGESSGHGLVIHLLILLVSMYTSKRVTIVRAVVVQPKVFRPYANIRLKSVSRLEKRRRLTNIPDGHAPILAVPRNILGSL